MCAKSLNTEHLSKTPQAAFLIDETAEFAETVCNGLTQRYLNLSIFGKELNLVISFNDRQIRLCEIIPAARAICDKIVDATRSEVEKLGYTIPCKKFCSKCCRNLVPISAAEAIWKSEEIEQLPLNEQKILRRSIELAQRKLLAAKPPKFDGKDSDQKISDWYESLDLVCPFLNNNLCTIYQSRPLACREHIVVGQSCCSESDSQTNQTLDLPVSILEAVSQLCEQTEEYKTKAVMLPVSMQWATYSKNANTKTYYVSELLDRLINIITAQTENKKATLQTS